MKIVSAWSKAKTSQRDTIRQTVNHLPASTYKRQKKCVSLLLPRQSQFFPSAKQQGLLTPEATTHTSSPCAKENTEKMDFPAPFRKGLLSLKRRQTLRGALALAASSLLPGCGASVPSSSGSPGAPYFLTTSGTELTCYVPCLSAVLIQTP